ncbi:MAG TPA: cation:proton antiporter [Rubricoccaceae bacterium]|nr:cation:proton antiporter [Rubricoccaceae bacterium]
MPVLAAAELPFLYDLVVVFAAAIVLAYVCYRLRLVPIAGFLIAGVLVGPHALGLVSDPEIVEVLAEVGVILLLFTIGVEFSLEKLTRIARDIFVGGGLQVGLTVGLVAAGLATVGVAWSAGIYTGFLVALSSTAIVLGVLADRRETDSPVGRLVLAVLIFQDLAVVAMVLFVPVLAGEAATAGELALVFGKAAVLVAAVLVLARRVVPPLLARVAHTRRQELFLLAVVAVCFGTAALSAVAGVSLALGAFLAGLVVSASAYSEQALSEVLPLRVLFSAVFFVSVGMLLDVGFLVTHPLLVLGAAAGVVLLKLVLTGVSVLALGYPVRLAAAVGLVLAQIGEFSFVLERAGAEAGLSPAGLGETGSQAFIAATVLLMLLTPFLMQGAPALSALLDRTPLRRLGREPAEPSDVARALEDHVILVGYGLAGQRLVRVLQPQGIPFEVVEMNPAAVDRLRAAGVPALWGDASRQVILEHAGAQRAKLLVVAINDPEATPRIVQAAHLLNPTLQIIVRTRFVHEVERLVRLGADVVVPEELETTVRLFTHVLGAYMVPPEETERLVQALRAEDYGVLRGSIQEAHLMVLQGLDEEGLHTRAVAVRAGAPAAGQTLAALQLRREHGLTVLAVRRGSHTLANPAGDFVVEPGDRLVMVGTADEFAASADLFRAPPAEPA